MKKAIVLFSGGQDSTTCLFWAKNQFDMVVALNVFYGQRHKTEVDSARIISKMAGVELIEFPTDLFQTVGDSALIGDGEISTEHRSSPALPASFVPGRNIILLTIAAMVGYKMGIESIVTGVCQTDFSGYPDCRDDTIRAVNKALCAGMDFPFDIYTPLMGKTKAETVEMADQLPGCMGALAFSHTCYEGEFPPCGKCPACLLRQKGFEEAGVPDPLFSRGAKS